MPSNPLPDQLGRVQNNCRALYRQRNRYREALERLVAAVENAPGSTRRESWLSAEEFTHIDPDDWAGVLDAASHGAAVLNSATPDEQSAKTEGDDGTL